MIDYLAMRLFHVIDNVRISGLRSVIREVVYSGRIAVPVEMDLKNVQPYLAGPHGEGLKCLDIDPGFFKNGRYDYQFKNRRLKAYRNLKKGLLGYGLLRGREMVADLWYSSPALSPGSPEHGDLKWLGISPHGKYAYAFDMFLVPAMRGRNMATYVQGSFLLKLRERGIERVYGYYWSDNLAALWMHRMLKWRELGKVRASRFLTLRRYRRVQ